MSQPEFSILTVVEGPEPRLADLIESVREQGFDAWELIVADASGEAQVIADKYGDERIVVSRTDSHGFGAGINHAAAQARGQIYTVVRPHHKLMPTFCARTHQVLQEHSDTDVVAVDAAGFTDDGALGSTTFRRDGGITEEPGIGHRITLAEYVAGSVLYYTAAIRAAAWQSGGGYENDLPTVEGLMLFARMLAQGSVVRLIPEPLAGYRIPEEPGTHRIYQDSVQVAFTRIAELTDDPATRETALRKRGDIRFHQAMDRARSALASSDTTSARAQVRIALGERFALKPAAIYAALTVAPGALRLAQSAKTRLRTG
ncbi:glycosyltransferase [Nocardia huaxiensis]|uniref:Glycosyltransferase n=1 Tax=Nocardia huaxiensis TaxID=2755382 RepID=A0A7D6Z6U9_9NOCA|nr:glycosyltransferase [Nocardia huaxiensis]QLY28228.1 glycosyltransferase [Nocardia huaxiensis]UFS98337.1 glycosyltransferase [Nocardia huaxiensis]